MVHHRRRRPSKPVGRVEFSIPIVVGICFFLTFASIFIGPFCLAYSVWDYPFPGDINQWFETNCSITQSCFAMTYYKGAPSFSQWRYEVSYIDRDGFYETGKICRICVDEINKQFNDPTNLYFQNTTYNCWIPPGIVNSYSFVQSALDPQDPEFNNHRSAFFQISSASLSYFYQRNLNLFVSGLFFMSVNVIGISAFVGVVLFGVFKAKMAKKVHIQSSRKPEMLMANTMLILGLKRKNGKPFHPKCQVSRLPNEMIYRILHFAMENGIPGYTPD